MNVHARDLISFTVDQKYEYNNENVNVKDIENHTRIMVVVA